MFHSPTFDGHNEVVKDDLLLIVDNETESITKERLELYFGSEGIVDENFKKNKLGRGAAGPTSTEQVGKGASGSSLTLTKRERARPRKIDFHDPESN